MLTFSCLCPIPTTSQCIRNAILKSLSWMHQMVLELPLIVRPLFFPYSLQRLMEAATRSNLPTRVDKSTILNGQYSDCCFIKCISWDSTSRGTFPKTLTHPNSYCSSSISNKFLHPIFVTKL